MNRRLDLPIAIVAHPVLDLPVAVAVWLIGLGWVARTGNWTPLAVAAVAAAGRLIAHDPSTRSLLAPNRAALALGAAGGAAMIAATYLLYPPLARAVPGLASGTRSLYALLDAGALHPTVLAAVLVLVATSEEVLWRGRLLVTANGDVAPSGRAAQLGRAVAFAALYGAAHGASGSPLLAGVAFLCGCAWGLLRLASGSLWPPVIAHALWDVAVLVLWPVA